MDVPICGDDYSPTASPAPCDSPQGDTNATGPSNTNANGPQKSSRSRKALQFGKGTMSWDYKIPFVLRLIKVKVLKVVRHRCCKGKDMTIL